MTRQRFFPRIVRSGKRWTGSLAVAGARRLLAGFAIVSGMVLVSVDAHAGWWSRAPVDFEDCAAGAEKNATSSEEKGQTAHGMRGPFAGRRKPGGGYTYYDFMQNRHFDIAGPNPTTEEQRHIDEQYAAFLKDQRRSIIAAVFQKRQQAEQANATPVASDKADPVNIRLAPAPKTPVKRLAVLPRPRPKAAPHCGDEYCRPATGREFQPACRTSKTLSSVLSRRRARTMLRPFVLICLLNRFRPPNES